MLLQSKFKEERVVSSLLWPSVIAIGCLAAIINFGIAASRRKQPMVAVVRVLAGLVSLAVSVGIIIGKAFRLEHPTLQWQEVVIGFGVFIFAVLLLPSYVGKDEASENPRLTLQQRAARPVNATIRLRDAATDEWVN
jgi:protein-S-isoprenylcysteine O-methyltransferase Ste14